MAKLLFWAVVIPDTTPSNMGACLFSHSLSCKMCVILDVLCQPLIVSYYLCHKFYMQKQKFPDWLHYRKRYMIKCLTQLYV